MTSLPQPPSADAALSDIPNQVRFRWIPVVVLLAIGLLWWGPAPAIAQNSQLGWVLDDDLALIAYADYSRTHNMGSKHWEVWICDLGVQRSFHLNLSSITRSLNRQIPPYFSWLSRGRYVPTFSSGGTVLSPDLFACDDEVLKAEGNQIHPALVIVITSSRVNYSLGGVGWPGYFIQEGSTFNWPRRALAMAGAASVVAIEGRKPTWGDVAHAIGRALTFPQSYGGLNFGYGEFEDVWDNPMDVMSRGSFSDLWIGTLAVNRYAAGWIDSGEVIIHETGEGLYELSPLGVSGDQMLVIPTGEGPGVFYTLGARVAKGFDWGIPKEGVEVYLIDQRTTACHEPARFACWGQERRTQQVPAVVGYESTLHVLGVGEGMDLGDVRIEVIGRRGDRFTVSASSCSSGNFVGLFCDEDGSVHEANIETLASWQITLGCEHNRFCPQNLITRNQMAAFLYRTVSRQYGTPPASAVDMADVNSGAWYREFAEWAVSAEVMSLDAGQFKPQNVVTRADMAVMMTAAFPDLIPTGSAQRVFTDTTGLSETIIRAIESLYRAGVSLGCSTSPLRFCPDQPVTRAQMASFFVRALNLQN